MFIPRAFFCLQQRGTRKRPAVESGLLFFLFLHDVRTLMANNEGLSSGKIMLDSLERVFNDKSDADRPLNRKRLAVHKVNFPHLDFMSNGVLVLTLFSFHFGFHTRSNAAVTLATPRSS